MKLINDRVYVKDTATTAIEIKSNSVVVYVRGGEFEFPAKDPSTAAHSLAKELMGSSYPNRIEVEAEYPPIVHDYRPPMSTEEFKKLPYSWVVTQECIAGHKCRQPDRCPHKPLSYSGRP